jgi:hypothetical protein
MNRHARMRTVLAALLLLTGGGCGAPAPEAAADDEGPDTAFPLTDESLPPQPVAELPPLPPESIPARPREVRDTLMIEGMPELATSRLVESPAGFGLRFSTYVPEGLGVDFSTDADSGGIRFHAAFAGQPDRNAYMHVYVYPEGSTGIEARSAAFEFLRSRFLVGDEVNPADVPEWGREAYGIAYSGDGGAQYVGRMVIGSRGDRYFHVLTHYPAEYGDGLGPRFDRILRSWRWEDSGRYLVRP